MSHGFFIAGTDTHIGKTLVAAALLHAYADLGYRVLGMKPVAAGAELIDGVWVNEDVAMLRAAGNVQAAPALLNPYLFREAIAPHIAAEHKGVRIEIPRIRAAYDELAAQAEVVLVEGVGGLLVPLSEHKDAADLAVALNLPLILVVGMRLGCINHALLTVEAIAARGLKLAGWVANRVDPEMAAYEENLAALVRRIAAPLLAEIPGLTSPDPDRMAATFAPKKLMALLAG
ncbi:MAG: dethiobiotin synthase [Pseudomonadota bacterium]|nr:dethiobiotin synthase [Pseudomonadota bacterium]